MGKHRSFLVNFVQSSDHVTMSLTGSLKAKMVCRIRTKTLGVKHGDGGDRLKISRRMELKAVLAA